MKIRSFKFINRKESRSIIFGSPFCKIMQCFSFSVFLQSLVAIFIFIMYNTTRRSYTDMCLYLKQYQYPGVAQLVARLLWELEHQNGSTSRNVAHSPLSPQLPLITSVESSLKMC